MGEHANVVQRTIVLFNSGILMEVIYDIGKELVIQKLHVDLLKTLSTFYKR